MKRITKLVALSAAAIALSFSAITASATLIGLEKITASATCDTTLSPLCPAGELFSKTGSGSFALAVGKFTITASFGADETVTLQFVNKTTKTQALLPGTEMYFGGLQFDDGSQLLSFTGVTLTSDKRDLSSVAIGSVVAVEDYTGSGFGLDFVDPAPAIQIGETVTLRGTMVKGVPEPGSLALLGAVLVAFGAIHLRRRVRS